MEAALHVTTDSRRVRAGSVFVALRGREADGHAWIPEAVRRGAVGVVGEDPTWVEWFRTQAPSIPYWVVRSGRQAAARLTRALYGPVLDRLVVMAVTGTKGKTGPFIGFTTPSADWEFPAPGSGHWGWTRTSGSGRV
jgi:UDP-N-acetylmuramoyl-L-alanyl-D-glutamate--2,6-diaminopimelate ligase